MINEGNYKEYRNDLSEELKNLRNDGKKESAKLLLEKAKDTDFYIEAKECRDEVISILRKLGAKYSKIGGIETKYLDLDLLDIMNELKSNYKEHSKVFIRLSKFMCSDIKELGEYLALPKDYRQVFPTIGRKTLDTFDEHLTKHYGINPNKINTRETLEIIKYEKEKGSHFIKSRTHIFSIYGY